jgi:hypothetical protein
MTTLGRVHGLGPFSDHFSEAPAFRPRSSRTIQHSLPSFERGAPLLFQPPPGTDIPIVPGGGLFVPDLPCPCPKRPTPPGHGFRSVRSFSKSKSKSKSGSESIPVPHPQASSKTPPRLCASARGSPDRNGGAGWESGCLFGRPPARPKNVHVHVHSEAVHVHDDSASTSTRIRVRGVFDQSDPCRNRNRDRNRFLFRIPKPARKRHRASARGSPDGNGGAGWESGCLFG